MIQENNKVIKCAFTPQKPHVFHLQSPFIQRINLNRKTQMLIKIRFNHLKNMNI
jgi:hypothetical protein